MTVTATHPELRRLALVSAAQLGANVAGQLVAVRRRLPYDVAVPPMAGRPEDVVRDSVLMGTALSAPLTMLALQSAATVGAFGGRSGAPVRVLTVLGGLMVYGYLGERVVRARLRPGGFDPVESAVAASGLGFAAAMAVLGARRWRRD